MRVRGAVFSYTSLDQPGESGQGCRQRVEFGLSERSKVTIEHGTPGLADDLEDRIPSLGQFDQDDTLVRIIDAAPYPALRLHGVHKTGTGWLTNTFELGQVRYPLGSQVSQGGEREPLGQAHPRRQDRSPQEAVEPRQDRAQIFGQFLGWGGVRFHR